MDMSEHGRVLSQNELARYAELDPGVLRRVDIQLTIEEWAKQAVDVINTGLGKQFVAKSKKRAKLIRSVFYARYVDWCNDVAAETTTSELLFELICYLYVCAERIKPPTDNTNLAERVSDELKSVNQFLFNPLSAVNEKILNAVVRKVAPLIVYGPENPAALAAEKDAADEDEKKVSVSKAQSSKKPDPKPPGIKSQCLLLCSMTARLVFWGHTFRKALVFNRIGDNCPRLSTRVLREKLFSQRTETSDSDDRFLESFTHEKHLAMGAREYHRRKAFDAWRDIPQAVLLKSDSAKDFTVAVDAAADDRLDDVLACKVPEDHLCYDAWVMILWQRYMAMNADVEFVPKYFMHAYEIHHEQDRWTAIDDNLRVRRPIIVHLAGTYWVQSVDPDDTSKKPHVIIRCRGIIEAIAAWVFVLKCKFDGKLETDFDINRACLDALCVELLSENVDDEDEDDYDNNDDDE